MIYRRVSVDLDEDGNVLGSSVEWHDSEQSGPIEIWTDPSPVPGLWPATAFRIASFKERAQLSLWRSDPASLDEPFPN